MQQVFTARRNNPSASDQVLRPLADLGYDASEKKDTTPMSRHTDALAKRAQVRKMFADIVHQPLPDVAKSLSPIRSSRHVSKPWVVSSWCSCRSMSSRQSPMVPCRLQICGP